MKRRAFTSALLSHFPLQQAPAPFRFPQARFPLWRGRKCFAALYRPFSMTQTLSRLPSVFRPRLPNAYAYPLFSGLAFFKKSRKPNFPIPILRLTSATLRLISATLRLTSVQASARAACKRAVRQRESHSSRLAESQSSQLATRDSQLATRGSQLATRNLRGRRDRVDSGEASAHVLRPQTYIFDRFLIATNRFSNFHLKF